MRHNLRKLLKLDLPRYPLKTFNVFLSNAIKLGTLLQEVKEWGWVGFKKSYVINRVGQAKILCLLIWWVGQKQAQNMLT